MALSMLGYRCCSDIRELPTWERENLFAKEGRLFDAYVNVGSLESVCVQLAHLYPNAKFIVTVKDERERNSLVGGIPDESSKVSKNDGLHSKRVIVDELCRQSVSMLILSAEESNKWKVLCEFLGCDAPTSRYPAIADQPQRRPSSGKSKDRRGKWPKCTKLKWDSSPWIAIPNRKWRGISLDNNNKIWSQEGSAISITDKLESLDVSRWMLLDDTFPSNLALF